eukprot:TRINITY_DN77972_c0_g1_i1.p1 TRINITY_DN77972_c0_g1~~TRINITY_DN77972_c0_g1_i1.p1  ORF type:complete len:1087 (-),score=219.88 TRINITY_DN77972_c0_g1_i1:38-3298(-)
MLEALADFDASAYGDEYVSLRSGDAVKVEDEDAQGWAFGCVGGLLKGWFPGRYIGQVGFARADFAADAHDTRPGEYVSLKRRQRVVLFREPLPEGGWSYGRVEDRLEGWLPTDFVQPLADDAQCRHQSEVAAGNVAQDLAGSAAEPAELEGELLTRHKHAVERLGIKCREMMTSLPMGGFICQLTWMWPGGDTTRTMRHGVSEMGARAAAAQEMVALYGEMPRSADDWKLANQLVRELKEPCRTTLPDLLERGVALARDCGGNVHDHFLGRLVEVGLGLLDEGKVVTFLQNLVSACKARLGARLWAGIVDAAGRCVNPSVAASALAIVTAELCCTLQELPGWRRQAIFLRYRSWLAYEGQADLQQSLRSWAEDPWAAKEVWLRLEQVDRKQGFISLIASYRSELPAEGEYLALRALRGSARWEECTLLQTSSVKLKEDWSRIAILRPVAAYQDWWQEVEKWQPGTDLKGLTLSAFGVSHQRMASALHSAFVVRSRTTAQAWMPSPVVCDLLLDMDISDLRSWPSGSPGNDDSDHCSIPNAAPPVYRNLSLHDISVELTGAQQNALDQSLKLRLSCVQGPPGTGKTATAVSIVQAWRRVLAGNVLCCAESNAAADHLASSLLKKGVKCVRMGHNADFEGAEHMQHLPGYRDYVRAKGKHGPGVWQRSKLEKQAIEAFGVVVSTCIGSGHQDVKKVSFTSVIVDECTQATLPSTLVPLLGAERVVLIGDHQQLPPTVLDENIAQAGFQRSLFERLVLARPSWSVMLDVQWRMHPSIAEFPSREFYDGRVVSHPSCMKRRKLRGFNWPASGVHVLCVDVQGLEESCGASTKNTKEVEAILQLLPSASVPPEDIGVITPYNGQKALLRKALRSAGFGGVTVDTVDGFQGSERELIFFSAVRNNASGRIGFLSDRRRMNVAFTRARCGLIIVASKDTLASAMRSHARQGSTWSKWFWWAHAAAAVVPDTCSALRAHGDAPAHNEGPQLTPRAEVMLAEAVRAVSARRQKDASAPLAFTRKQLQANGVTNSEQLVQLLRTCSDADWARLGGQHSMPLELLHTLRAAETAQAACGLRESPSRAPEHRPQVFDV